MTSFVTSPCAKDKMIFLRTNDDRAFSLPRKAIGMSFTIGEILRDLGVDEYNDFFEEIPLPDVSGPIFEKIAQWCVYHMDDPPYVHIDPREQRTDDIPLWDQDFLNVDHAVLFEIILAATKLDIKPLLNTCCKTVANMIKVGLVLMEETVQGKPLEVVMATFNIENDFTPEEMELIRGENLYCEN